MSNTRSGLPAEVNEAFFLYQRLDTNGHPIKNDTILIPCNEVSRFLCVQISPSRSVEHVKSDHSAVFHDGTARKTSLRTPHTRKNQPPAKLYAPGREDEVSSDNLDGSKPSKKQKKLKRRIKDKKASKAQAKTGEAPRCSSSNQETSPSPILLFNIINPLPCSYPTANTIGTIGQSNQTYFDPEYTAEQERKRAKTSFPILKPRTDASYYLGANSCVEDNSQCDFNGVNADTIVSVGKSSNDISHGNLPEHSNGCQHLQCQGGGESFCRAHANGLDTFTKNKEVEPVEHTIRDEHFGLRSSPSYHDRPEPNVNTAAETRGSELNIRTAHSGYQPESNIHTAPEPALSEMGTAHSTPGGTNFPISISNFLVMNAGGNVDTQHRGQTVSGITISNSVNAPREHPSSCLCLDCRNKSGKAIYLPISDK